MCNQVLRVLGDNDFEIEVNGAEQSTKERGLMQCVVDTDKRNQRVLN